MPPQRIVDPYRGAENPSRIIARRDPQAPISIYWDSLSKVHLTEGALRELDRKNRFIFADAKSGPKREENKKKDGNKPLVYAPYFLQDCSEGCLNEVKRLARAGGPDMSDVVNYPHPLELLNPRGNRNREESHRYFPQLLPGAEHAEGQEGSSSATVFSCNFEQHLIDHGIYPPDYTHPNGQKPRTPINKRDILIKLNRPQSADDLDLTELDFKRFLRKNRHASKENPITLTLAALLDGDLLIDDDYEDISRTVGRGIDPDPTPAPVRNYPPLTNTLIEPRQPDHYYGSKIQDLNIYKENKAHPTTETEKLFDRIISTTYPTPLILSNFFLEVNHPDEVDANVIGAYIDPGPTVRKAMYNGALGARTMHYLQSHIRNKNKANTQNKTSPRVTLRPTNDFPSSSSTRPQPQPQRTLHLVSNNNQRPTTITATYTPATGTLTLYTTHISPGPVPPTSSIPGDGDDNNYPEKKEYVMTKLGDLCLVESYEGFVEAVGIYRNARDWAREWREGVIGLVNRLE